MPTSLWTSYGVTTAGGVDSLSLSLNSLLHRIIVLYTEDASTPLYTSPVALC